MVSRTYPHQKLLNMRFLDNAEYRRVSEINLYIDRIDIPLIPFLRFGFQPRPFHYGTDSLQFYFLVRRWRRYHLVDVRQVHFRLDLGFSPETDTIFRQFRGLLRYLS